MKGLLQPEGVKSASNEKIADETGNKTSENAAEEELND